LPEHAFRTALQLNNRYFLDGRDANSYANVAWAFGLHDRPWPERPVFGKVRSMTAKGLERKFDMKSYRYAVERLVDQEHA
jgi:deoxyribodipyrimidine photo-lyase